MKRLRSGLLALVGGLCGCDAAAPADYSGAPIHVIEGPIFGGFSPAGDLAGLRGRLRLGVFWSGPGFAAPVEYPSVPHAPDAERYVVPFFDTAPLRGPWAIGRLQIYIDVDGDGRLGPDEPIEGALPNEGALFVTTPVSAADSPTGRSLTPGMTMVPLPLTCGATPTVEGPPCDVPTGRLCAEDVECGTGTCVWRQPRHWVEKVCLVTGRAPGCTPRDAVWVPGPTLDVWVPACEADADCPEDEMYCAAAIGGCLSARGGFMQRGSAMPPVCLGDR